MSALAIYLKKNSINVTGSDIAHNANTVILEKYKIPLFSTNPDISTSSNNSSNAGREISKI